MSSLHFPHPSRLPAVHPAQALGALLAIPAVGLLTACGGAATAGNPTSQASFAPLAA